uniref:Vimentin n=1 Tax=Pan troglodytes TaxID=9598 RepID=K7DTI4_PANTR
MSTRSVSSPSSAGCSRPGTASRPSSSRSYVTRPPAPTAWASALRPSTSRSLLCLVPGTRMPRAPLPCACGAACPGCGSCRTRLDFSLADAINTEVQEPPAPTRRVDLQELNTASPTTSRRCASWKQQNKILLAELEQLKGQGKSRPGEPLRGGDAGAAPPGGPANERQSPRRGGSATTLAEDIMRLPEEIAGRRCFQREGKPKTPLQSFRQDVDNAALARLDLERKVESLQEEIRLFGRNLLEE